MLHLLFFFLFALIQSNHHSDTFTFDNNTPYEDLSSNSLFQQSIFPEITNPITIYCISKIDFLQPFSLNLSSKLDTIRQTNQQSFKINMKNTLNPLFISISIKWIVMTAPKAFKTQEIYLNYYSQSKTIDYDMMVKPQNQANIRKGYFITGFSSSLSLNSLKELTLYGHQYKFEFEAKRARDYIKLIYFIFDVTPEIGCINNNVMNQKPITNNYNLGYFSQSKETQTIKVLGGLSKIKGNRANVTELGDLVQITDHINVEYVTLKLDTTCTINNNFITAQSIQPTLPQLELFANTFPIQSSISNQNIPIVPHNSTINPIPLPTTALPVINGSGYPLSPPTSPISPVVPSDQTVKAIKQGGQDLALTSIHDPIIKEPNQQIIGQIDIENSPKDNIREVLVVNSQQISKPNPPIPSLRTQSNSVIPILTDEQMKHTRVYIERDYTISAWNILGFIILIWIGISFIAIPFLCCALKSTKNNLESSVHIVQRVQYSPQFNRGTDVRLIGNQVVVQSSPQLVGNIKPRNSMPSSIPSQITVQLVEARNSDPTSNTFKSQNGSGINNPNANIPQQNQVLTYQQLLHQRNPSQKYQKSFQDKRKMSSSMIEVQKNLDDSKSDRSSHLQMDPPSSSNMQSITQTNEIKVTQQQPIKVLQNLPIQSIKYQDHYEPSQSENPFDIKLSALSRYAKQNQQQIKYQPNQQNQQIQYSLNLQNQSQNINDPDNIKQLQQSIDNFQSCFETPINIQPSIISQSDLDPTSRITEKIGNLFGNIQNQQLEDIKTTQNNQQEEQKDQPIDKSQSQMSKMSQIKSSLAASTIKQADEQKQKNMKNSLSNSQQSKQQNDNHTFQKQPSKTDPQLPEKDQSISPQEIEYQLKKQQSNISDENQ